MLQGELLPIILSIVYSEYTEFSVIEIKNNLNERRGEDDRSAGKKSMTSMAIFSIPKALS